MSAKQPKQLSHSTQNLWRLIAFFGFSVFAASWSIALWHSHQVTQQLFSDTGRRMQTTAESYAKHAALSMAVADESLNRLRDTLERDGEAGFDRLARYMSRDDKGGGVISRVARVNKEGKTLNVYSKGMPAISVDVSDRAYFQAFRDDPRDRILVTEPIIGRATGELIVLFVRPVLVQGEFAGVVFVGMDADQFSKMVNTAGEEGLLIALLSPGNRIVARSEGSKTLLGREFFLPPQAMFSEAFDLVSPVDNVTRRFAVRNVPDWGMRVIVGMDHSVIQAEIDGNIRAAIFPALLLTLLLLPTLFVLRRAFLRQQTAEHERDSDALRLRTILGGMSEGVVLVDASATVTFANAAATKQIAGLQGKNFNTALGDAGLVLVTEDGNAYAAADPLSYVCLEAGLELDDAWLMESSHENSMRWLAMCARPLRAENGEINGAVITLDDRTDEHERIANAEMSRTILARMEDAVMITDERAHILVVNNAYLRLSGYSEADLIGKQPSRVRSKRHDDAFWADMWQALTQQKQWSGKVWNLRKDGSEYCVWHTITSVHDQRGRVVRYVAVSRDITELQAKEDDLWQRANFDPLTNLANRTRFFDRLAHTVTASARHKQCFAVCYLDLDRFKPVNDTFGHAAGDELLRQVAQRMLGTLRKEDTLARIGGDEFALLMPRIASSNGAITAAEKILAAVHSPFVLDAGTVDIGISLGIAIYPEHGETADALVAAADQALYSAKVGGRNTWRLANTSSLAESPGNAPIDPLS